MLDAFDRFDLWKDTLLIVCTDHSFLLGEHDWWGRMAPLYNEVANTPFFLYDPRRACPKSCGALCQTIDIAPTLLEYFGVKIPKDMMGKPLIRYRTGDYTRVIPGPVSLRQRSAAARYCAPRPSRRNCSALRCRWARSRAAISVKTGNASSGTAPISPRFRHEETGRRQGF